MDLSNKQKSQLEVEVYTPDDSMILEAAKDLANVVMSMMRTNMFTYSTLLFLVIPKRKKIDVIPVYSKHEFAAMATSVLWSLMVVAAQMQCQKML